MSEVDIKECLCICHTGYGKALMQMVWRCCNCISINSTEKRIEDLTFYVNRKFDYILSRVEQIDRNSCESIHDLEESRGRSSQHIIDLKMGIESRLNKMESNISSKGNFFQGLLDAQLQRIDDLSSQLDCFNLELKAKEFKNDMGIGERYMECLSGLENKMKSRIDDLEQLIYERNDRQKREPHKCPVCDGKYIAIFKDCECACLACEKGIVWG